MSNNLHNNHLPCPPTNPLFPVSQAGGFSPSIVKAAMTMVTGIDVGPARKPIRQLTQDQLQALRLGLTNAGFKLH